MEVELTRYVVSGGRLSAGGVVRGVVEEGGTCVLTLTAAGESVVAEGAATASASSMACGDGLDVEVAGLAAPWTLVLAYRSPTAAGESTPFEVSE